MDKLVSWIQNHYSELVQSMRDCTHHSESSLNPYHLEGDVWSHTLMCMEKAKSFDELLQFAVMTHDIGKPTARKESNGKTSFKGHELISAYMSLPLSKEYGFSKEDILKIFKLIAYHTSILKLLDQDNCLTQVLEMHKGHPDLFLDLLYMTQADGLGRIMENYNEKLNYIDDYFAGTLDAMFFNKNEKKEEQATLTCLIGLPGSGKSSYLKKENIDVTQIICRDDIIMKNSKSNDYTSIAKLSDRDKKEVAKKIDNMKAQLVTQKKDIYLDMTHLTDKDRHLSLKGIPRNYWFKAIIFISDLETIKDRNAKREKNVPWEYSENLLKRSNLPLYDEFDEIQWILSD